MSGVGGPAMAMTPGTLLGVGTKHMLRHLVDTSRCSWLCSYPRRNLIHFHGGSDTFQILSMMSTSWKCELMIVANFWNFSEVRTRAVQSQSSHHVAGISTVLLLKK